MNRPIRVCLTPVKNEAWILDRFLAAAALWADVVIVADQGSDDQSVEIASRHQKAVVVANPSTVYDEGARQRLLLEEARRIPGATLLVALDADEMLSSNWSSSEWATMDGAPRGTVLRFPWISVKPDLTTCWVADSAVPFGFVDDGSSHSGQKIHSTRIPVPAGAGTVCMSEINVLHLQYTDWPRMQSKQRWYQCWETINNPGKRPIAIYRQYHHMEGVRADELRPMDPGWLLEYERAGIGLAPPPPEPYYRWDREILDLFSQYGADRFRKLNIWDVDWPALARRAKCTLPEERVRDPRTSFDRAVHRWLKKTQADSLNPRVRTVQRMLRLFGW